MPLSARQLALASIMPCLVLCLVLFLHASPARAAQPVAATNSAWDEMLEQVWSNRFNDLNILRNDVEQYATQVTLQKSPAEYNIKLHQLKQEKNRLQRLYAASSNRPTEQLGLLVLHMYRLRSEIADTLAPLQHVSATTSAYMASLEQFKTEMSLFASDTEYNGDDYEKIEKNHLLVYEKELQNIATQLNALEKSYQRPLATATKLMDDFNNIIQETKKNLTVTWKNYYISRVEYSTHNLGNLPGNFFTWLRVLWPSLLNSLPHSPQDWSRMGISFILAFGLLGGAGILLYRKAEALPKRWQDSVHQVVKGAWLWFSAGVALIIASKTEYGGFYFISSFIGILLLIWGVGTLGWRLRLAGKPELSGQPLPFGRLFPPAALGMICLHLEMPTRLLGLFWGLSMLIFFLIVCSINKKQKKAGHALPRLERGLYGCAKYIGLFSLLVSLAGYPRLAIIIFMALFALVNIVTLGNALGILFKILVDKTFNKEALPFSNALIRSVVAPLAWVSAIIFTLPWQWGTPGSGYLIRYAIGVDYKIGSLDIDITRFVIVLLLFFLFRTLIRLGRSSLELLPQNMPNVERGVIPPLQTLTTYAMWALFVVVALGIFGVSLTSLAVVAGGLSVGIGFGMQNIFNNLVSGLMLMFGRSIMVGDAIDIDDISGVVTKISVRSTTIRTWDLAQVNVPNSTLMSSQFTNWTRGSRTVRKKVTVGAGYDSNPAQVYKLMLQAAENDPHVLKKPAPYAIMTNFGDSSLDFTLYFVVDDFSVGTSTEARVRCEVLRLFNENGISIPYPQLDLHLPDADSEANPQAEKSTILPNGTANENRATIRATLKEE